MSRVQLALNVGDLEVAIEHYSKLFGVMPNKVKDGYANFVVTEPPLKLVLIANPDQPGTLNHLGVEVATAEEVQLAIRHATDVGLPVTVEESTTCCFAVQDKVWVGGGELPWEFYTVLEDADVMHLSEKECCMPVSVPAGVMHSAKPSTSCC